MAHPFVNEHIEKQGEKDPKGGPSKRFFNMDLVRVALEDLQVQNQHRHDEEIKNDPVV
jgi:hypothetical protein